MKAFLSTVLKGQLLDRTAAARAMRAMLAVDSRPEQIAALLAALALRGECLDELAGFLEVLRQEALPVPVKSDIAGELFDTCGTGGDGHHSFNISTAVAFVLAGGGVRVAKHGNRSASGACGSADVLEALGVSITLTPPQAAAALERDRFAFLFAPIYHPALARLAALRRSLAFRTVFNTLGPLANPARATRQLVGVSDRRQLPAFASLLRDAGCRSALVVAAEDGLDELSPAAPTHYARLCDGHITFGVVRPADFGHAEAPLSAIRGADATANARLLSAILDGNERGTARAVVEMNAAAAFVAAERAATFCEGVAAARRSLDSGAAAHALQLARRHV